MILFSMIVYLGCYTDETHPNGLKALQLDEKSGAMAIVAEYPVSNALYQALARDEYENAKAALPLVDADSRLGWEPTMEYCGGREQIEWKLRRMERIYGKQVAGFVGE